MTKKRYVDELSAKNFVTTSVGAIKKDPAGRYLNKIMANSVWRKLAQNPSGQQEIVTCLMIREYHDCLYTGQNRSSNFLNKTNQHCAVQIVALLSTSFFTHIK